MSTSVKVAVGVAVVAAAVPLVWFVGDLVAGLRQARRDLALRQERAG